VELRWRFPDLRLQAPVTREPTDAEQSRTRATDTDGGTTSMAGTDGERDE
jgi:hypothetical protein